jgi:hypothetical protein
MTGFWKTMPKKEKVALPGEAGTKTAEDDIPVKVEILNEGARPTVSFAPGTADTIRLINV